MVRIAFGSGYGDREPVEVEARTLGEALDRTEATVGDEVRVFVGGVDAARLEGAQTPVGDEDRVLVTRW